MCAHTGGCQDGAGSMAGAGPAWASWEWNTGGDVLWQLTMPSLRTWGRQLLCFKGFVWRKAAHSPAVPPSTSPCALDSHNHARGIYYVLEREYRTMVNVVGHMWVENRPSYFL